MSSMTMMSCSLSAFSVTWYTSYICLSICSSQYTREIVGNIITLEVVDPIPRFTIETYFTGDMASTRYPKLVELEGALMVLVFNTIWRTFMMRCVFVFVFVEVIGINDNLLNYWITLVVVSVIILSDVGEYRTVCYWCWC